MKYLWVILICLVGSRIFFHFSTQDHLAEGTKIRVNGRVSSEPYKYDSAQSVFVGGYYSYLPLYPEVEYGDSVTIEGIVDGRKLRGPKLISLNKTTSPLLAFRKSLLNVYQSSLPQDHAALVGGMTIGSKGLITTKFREQLKNTGTAHVVVASGMNVAMVAGFLINLLLGFLKRNQALIIAFIGIWIYAFIAGFDAPIIRAAIMASLTFSAQKIGRMNYAWRTLAITVGVMLLVLPEWITDLGFLLSVSATTSLMLFESKIRNRIGFVPRFIREDLSTTLAAQILVSPLLYIYFGKVVLIAPLINAMVLWTVPVVTMMGMLAGVVGIMFFPAGQAMLYLIYPLTWWFIFIVNIFS